MIDAHRRITRRIVLSEKRRGEVGVGSIVRNEGRVAGVEGEGAVAEDEVCCAGTDQA